MQLKSFFKLVEIQTKVASLIPFLLGTLFICYKGYPFHFSNALLFFCSMLLFDMTTTAINNYIDYTRAVKKEGYGYEVHNALGQYGLKPLTVRLVIYTLLIIATVLGICLVMATDYIVLLVGVICFGIGICYSFGPLPISRTPLGEVISGGTMGFAITFLAAYIHLFDSFPIVLSFQGDTFRLTCNYPLILSLVLLSIPAICSIANIMLANNICDMEEDLSNKRFTLPLLIGQAKALMLFRSLYYIGYIAIFLCVSFRVLPWVCLLTLLTLFPVEKHIRAFSTTPSKQHTFVLAVKNFLLIGGALLLTLLIGVLFV